MNERIFHAKIFCFCVLQDNGNIYLCYQKYQTKESPYYEGSFFIADYIQSPELTWFYAGFYDLNTFDKILSCKLLISNNIACG